MSDDNDERLRSKQIRSTACPLCADGRLRTKKTTPKNYLAARELSGDDRGRKAAYDAHGGNEGRVEEERGRGLVI